MIAGLIKAEKSNFNETSEFCLEQNNTHVMGTLKLSYEWVDLYSIFDKTTEVIWGLNSI